MPPPMRRPPVCLSQAKCAAPQATAQSSDGLVRTSGCQGILAGDVIIKVEGHPTESLPLKKVVELIQGEPGTKVKLTVRHEGAKTDSDVDITRAEIAVDSVLGDQR